MAKRPSERDVCRALAMDYRRDGWYAVSHVNLPRLSTWRCFDLLKQIGHPGQPEIDVLAYNPKRDTLHGIEVKYFRYGKVKTVVKTAFNEEIPVHEVKPKSYYEGIDEAHALLNFGVDFAWLCHVFDKNVSSTFVKKYSKWTSKILRCTYIGYLVITLPDPVIRKLCEPERNPLLEERELRTLRTCLIRALKEERTAKPINK